MSESNGVDKTPQQIKQEKFAANPEKFIDQDDIILAAVKSDKGIAVCTGAVPRSEMEVALSRINYRTFQLFFMMDMAKGESEVKKIITPSLSPIDFARSKR